MPRSSDEYTLSSSFLSVARKLESLLLPADRTSKFGVEGRSIAIINIASSSNMDHNSTTRRGGAYKTGDINIHHINVGDGDDYVRGNGADNSDNSIVLSSSFLYWGHTTKITKEEILQRCVVCVKSKRDSEGLRERGIKHSNATKVLSQTFGAANKLPPKKSEGGSESTKYTGIQYEYVENLAKIK